MKLPLYLALIGLLPAGAVLADPPAHAPAWGYHKHHPNTPSNKPYPKHKHYQGRSGAVYGYDYGIASGRCNRDEIGAVIGGVTGAVIGGQVAGRDDRVVGMVIGGVLGAVLGHAIGDDLDRNDRACMGHALELGKPGIPVRWKSNGHDYRFTPGGEARGGCRYADLSVDGRKPSAVLACPKDRGEWTFHRR